MALTMQQQVYLWLGLWRDEIPAKAVNDLQVALGPLSTLPAAGSGVGEPQYWLRTNDRMVIDQELGQWVWRPDYDSLRAQLAAAMSDAAHVRQANANYREENRLAIQRAETAESALSAQRREWIPVSGTSKE